MPPRDEPAVRVVHRGTVDTRGARRIWFDAAHQHLVIVQSQSVTAMPLWGGPITQIQVPAGTLAAALLAKFSLDHQLVAVQLAEGKVTVLHCPSGPRQAPRRAAGWNVSCRHTKNGNAILPGGVVWSEGARIRAA